MIQTIGCIIGLTIGSLIGVTFYPNNNYDLWLIIFPLFGAWLGASVGHAIAR